MEAIINDLLPVAIGVLTAAVAAGVYWLSKLVKKTDNKFDDAAFEAIVEGVKKAQEKEEKDTPAS